MKTVEKSSFTLIELLVVHAVPRGAEKNGEA